MIPSKQEQEEHVEWVKNSDFNDFLLIKSVFPSTEAAIIQAWRGITMFTHDERQDLVGLNKYDIEVIKSLIKRDNWHMSWQFSDHSLWTLARLLVKYRGQLAKIGIFYPRSIFEGCD
jgi:hypothetical protein